MAAFRKLLKEVADGLDSEDIDSLVFSIPGISKAKRSNMKSGRDLLRLMEEKDMISEDNLGCLKEKLEEHGLNKLAKLVKKYIDENQKESSDSVVKTSVERTTSGNSDTGSHTTAQQPMSSPKHPAYSPPWQQGMQIPPQAAKQHTSYSSPPQPFYGGMQHHQQLGSYTKAQQYQQQQQHHQHGRPGHSGSYTYPEQQQQQQHGQPEHSGSCTNPEPKQHQQHHSHGQPGHSGSYTNPEPQQQQQHHSYGQPGHSGTYNNPLQQQPPQNHRHKQPGHSGSYDNSQPYQQQQHQQQPGHSGSYMYINPLHLQQQRDQHQLEHPGHYGSYDNSRQQQQQHQQQQHQQYHQHEQPGQSVSYINPPQQQQRRDQHEQQQQHTNETQRLFDNMNINDLSPRPNSSMEIKRADHGIAGNVQSHTSSNTKQATTSPSQTGHSNDKVIVKDQQYATAQVMRPDANPISSSYPVQPHSAMDQPVTTSTTHQRVSSVIEDERRVESFERDGYTLKIISSNAKHYKKADKSCCVKLPWSSTYKICIANNNCYRCVAEVQYDGKWAGEFELRAGESTTIERPVYENRQFCFVKPESAPVGSGVRMDNPSNGIVSATFSPEKITPYIHDRQRGMGNVNVDQFANFGDDDFGYRSLHSNLTEPEYVVADSFPFGTEGVGVQDDHDVQRSIPGGPSGDWQSGATALMGHSNQKFNSADNFAIDESRKVEITIQLKGPNT